VSIVRSRPKPGGAAGAPGASRVVLGVRHEPDDNEDCAGWEIVCPDGRVRDYPYHNKGDAEDMPRS
jgi:hypothetical protein